MGVSKVSFHVSRVGVPVVVRVSYYPRWHASGASGPWRVSPNLMVVVPTARDVTLTYGADATNEVGIALTLAALAVAAGQSPRSVGVDGWATRKPVTTE